MARPLVSMENPVINDDILTERYHQLEKGIATFIRDIKKNGLAKKLQYYRASSSFDTSQYTDLLDDILNSQREKYILSLRQEIQHVQYLVSEYSLKLQKKKKKQMAENQPVRIKNEQLHNIYDKFNQRLVTLQNQQESSEKLYTNEINTLQYSYEFSQKCPSIQKDQLFPLCRKQTKAIQLDLSRQIKRSYGETISFFRSKFYFQLPFRIQQFVTLAQRRDLQEVYELKSNIDDAQSKNQQMNLGFQAIYDYIYSFAGVEANDIQKLVNQVPLLIKKLNKDIAGQYITDSKTQFFESIQSSNRSLIQAKKDLITTLSSDADNFVQSIKTALKQALKKKEDEYEKINAFYRKKRLKIQKKLDQAYEKLEEIYASKPNHTEIIDEMSLNDINFKDSYQKLDETIEQLVKSPLLSKIRNNQDPVLRIDNNEI